MHLDYPDKAESDGVIGKATLAWNKSDDVMYYVTWSEGFRPGLLNRPAGQSTPDGSIQLVQLLILMKLPTMNLVGRLFYKMVD